MTTSCTTNQYFSGQGSLLLATRNATTGAAEGFVPVGNVSSLTLGIETTTYEHKESCTGVRGIDLEIVQEIKVSAAFTMESMTPDNLAMVLYGSQSAVASASETDEQVVLYHDKWMPLANINVSAVIVGDDAVPTTTYTLGTDYVLNAEAGAIMALSTGAITDAQTVFVDYTSGDHSVVEAVETGTPPTRWGRFEGLNTADTDKPVTIDLYKMSISPLAELALITDEITQAEIETKILSDALRATGSKYFTVRKVV